MKSLSETTPDGRLRFNFHPGQMQAWDCPARFVAVLAGRQSGKTSFGPVWLWREIQRKGPGDYMVVVPTYPLLVKKALPEFLRLFKSRLRLGEYQTQQKIFTFSPEGAHRTFGAAADDEPTQVFFGHAQDPESLESATAKAAWLDEAGQTKFRLASWEAILGRLSIHQGRVLITTTPYSLGWLKQQIWDKWKAGSRDVEVVRFDSTENPAFPQEEYERARRDLPPWKFDMFYRAFFRRPAGLIYDSFDETAHKVKRFPVPREWPRYLGLDFGGVNTAGVFYAGELDAEGDETGRLFAYREYKAGSRSAAEHCYNLLRGEREIPFTVGGSHSEDQWRREFGRGGFVTLGTQGEARHAFITGPHEATGITVREPKIKDVEVGIDRVYATHRRGEILVFDDLAGYLEEKGTYSREIDEQGEPTEKIEDKETVHFMDAERYIIGYLKGKDGKRFRFW